MGYDKFSFIEPKLHATQELGLPDAALYLRISHDGYIALSMLTKATTFNETETVKILRNISPKHDFAPSTKEIFSIPIGYTTIKKLQGKIIEFIAGKSKPKEWTGIIAFEPHGFMIYGRWSGDTIELLLKWTP